MESKSSKTLETQQLVGAFLALLAASSSLEAIWYLGIAQDVYFSRIGRLMNTEFDLTVAVFFYLIYSLGALIFVVRPAMLARSCKQAARMGALYGFFCFSAHNLTDLADMKGFSLEITIIDMIWGTIMTAAACTLAYFLGRCLGKSASVALPAAGPN